MKKSLLWILLTFLLSLNACQISNQTLTSIPVSFSPTNIATATSTIVFTPTPTTTPTPTRESTPVPTPYPAVNQHITLMAVGDIMLGRTIGELILTEGAEAPFLFTAETLSSADITVGNLECPISTRGMAEEKTYAFRAPSEAGLSLAFAGFDVVSLANNHILDYGPLALEDTLKTLELNKIHPVGAGMDEMEAYAPVFIDFDGLRLAFLAFADIPPADYDYPAWEAGPDKPGIAWAHAKRIREGVRSAKSEADIVIVLVHNGYEIVQRVSGYQQETARLAIDNGASLVIGSHPHVLQRLETYNNGLIAYSMGNFIFDNFLFPPNYSAILAVELSANGVESYEMIDVIVQLNGVPQIVPYNLDN